MKRCLTLLCGKLRRELACPYSSARVIVRTPNAHDLPLSSGAQSVWPRPPTTHLQLVKTQYGIVRQQNRFSLLWYPNRVYGEDFFRKVFHCTKPLRGGLRESSAVCIFVGFCSSHTVVDFTFQAFFTMKLPIPLFFTS